MHLCLRGIVLCLVGFALVGSAATVGASEGSPVATPSVFPPGITFERLASSPPGQLGLPGPNGPGTMIEVLARITYAPGAAFDFHAPGPILYFVERGSLTVQLNLGHTVLVIPGHGPVVHSSTTFHLGQPITVTTGNGIYADDGYIGTTRNNERTLLTVLVTYLYTTHLKGDSHHVSATVAPNVSTPES